MRKLEVITLEERPCAKRLVQCILCDDQLFRAELPFGFNQNLLFLKIYRLCKNKYHPILFLSEQNCGLFPYRFQHLLNYHNLLCSYPTQLLDMHPTNQLC